MATPEQQSVYDKYANANSEGTLIAYPSAHVVSENFVSFINDWTPKDPFTVDVSHLGSVSFAEEIYYQMVMAGTFHTYWSSDQDPAGYGPGNINVIRLSRDGSKYIIHHHGVNQRDKKIQLRNPTLSLTDNSLTLQEGLVKVVIRIDNTSTPKGNTIYNYKITAGSRVYYNYYMSDFELV